MYRASRVVLAAAANRNHITVVKASEMAAGKSVAPAAVSQMATAANRDRITVVKASEMAAAKSAAPAAISQVVNRSVTKEEAPYVTPARESTKVSLMPWKGWFLRWLREQIGEARYKQWREFWFFMPDDVYDLEPIKPSQKVPVSKDGTVTRMYRYPSPGNEEPVRLPLYDTDEDPFDSGYYKRNTRDRYRNADGEVGHPVIERLKLSLLDQDDPFVQEELKRLEAGPQSSPGNGGVFATGPTNFDPTGLRATMSANWKAYNEELDKHMPDHLPTRPWERIDPEERYKHYDERGIPSPLGDYLPNHVPEAKVPVWRRVATW